MKKSLNKFTEDFIVSQRGQWDYPGLPTAVPTPSGKITTKGVKDDLIGIDNLGNSQYMTPNNEYQFEGDMVYEIPQAKKGGSKKPSKKLSRSLMAKNILFTKNQLFKKAKSVKNKIFDPNSPYFKEGGAFEIELDDAEIDQYRRGGYIVEELDTYDDGGEPCPQGFDRDPVTGECVSTMGQTERVQRIQEVSTNQYSPYISKYEESNPRDAYVYQKKADYLRKNKGLNKMAGLSQDNFNTDVEGNYNKNWEYDRNSEVIKQFAKDHGINPKNHVELVEKMADKGNVSYDMIANSKYGSKLQPSLWARSLAGAQELGNFVVKQLPGEQGDVFNKQTAGLTKKEWEDIHNSKFGALETLSATDIPGAVIGNALSDLSTATGGNYQESPGLLSGELKSNVDLTKAALLNPFLYAGIGQGLASAPKIAEGVANLYSKGLTGGKNLATKGKTMYTDIAEGGNMFDYAWKSPAARFDKDAVEFITDAGHGVIEMPESTALFNKLKTNPNLTAEELATIKDYEATSISYRSGPNKEKLDAIIKKSGLTLDEPTVMSRRIHTTSTDNFDPVNGIFNTKRPTSWSAGRDGLGNRMYSGSADRMVMKLQPGEYNMLKNPYLENSPETLDALTKMYEPMGSLEHRMQFVTGKPRIAEREILLGSGADLKQIGKVKNNFGGFDYIMKNLNKKQYGGTIAGTEGLTDNFSQRLSQFILDARTQGIDLNVSSGYRSYEKQKKLWEQALKKYGSPEKARKWVAPPGSSNHNRGTAVDLSSSGLFLGKDKNVKATEWAHANAEKYGLNFRMGHEPWHIEPLEKGNSKDNGKTADDHDHSSEFGNDEATKKEKLDLAIKNKDLEFENKKLLLAEQEKIKNDDNYSNWTPRKKIEDTDPTKALLENYSKIINPSLQNINDIYTSNLQGQMKRGGIIMNLDDDEIETYKKNGYVVENYNENNFEDGGTVSKTWELITGTPWADAKNKGYTTGSYDDNIALLKKLNSGELNVPKNLSEKVSTTDPLPIKFKPANPTLIKNIKTASSFNDAFAIARKSLGANHIFEYDGRKYGTNLKGETFNPSAEVLAASGMNTPTVKTRLKKENESLISPYLSKRTVKLQPDPYEDWEETKKKNAELNKKNNADKILSYKKKNTGDRNFVIVDKQKGLLHIYDSKGTQLYSSAVDLGAKNSDAQTVTKYKDLNNDGKISGSEINKHNVDWTGGNFSTGAGKFYISNIDKKGHEGLPILNMMNERQYDNYLKTGKVENVSTSFHKGYVKDDKSRVSNGCVRCNKTTLDNLTKYLENASEVYILPEDEGNKFVYENGKLNFKTAHKSEFYTYKDNNNIYQKKGKDWYIANKPGDKLTKINTASRITELNKNATNAQYDYYVDANDNVQKGQGINRTQNTLQYYPIKIKLNEEEFRKNKFTYLDLDDESELKNVKSYVKALEENKQKIMKLAKINGDVYNEVAKVSFGILGNESNFADTHDADGNLFRAINKYFNPKGASPDYYSKYYYYGAREDYRSAGLTQLRWSHLNADEKEILKKLNINSNKDFLEPTKAAIGTTAILAIRYNQQLDANEKKNILNNLPKTWGGSSSDNYKTYTNNVIKNSKYLNIVQSSQPNSFPKTKYSNPTTINVNKDGTKTVKYVDPKTNKTHVNVTTKDGKSYYKNYSKGGFIMDLDDDEIKKYIDGGYVVKEIN
jgi:D-alanyl-D-alanine dipeptidase